ncbi:hypothetical protein XBI1_220003 [Xenorhabdus bovienii str. Intermedium]|uniref:Uncharacterized protein n=1 Tax=Xenorhabdus bovienii str. Intermedium TaxID=1379677 RepID=A0A077QHT4_XENBV|nr:hypothetical protein XBI1_220003 [Xenorhabdus bovienii str. Intermedium]
MNGNEIVSFMYRHCQWGQFLELLLRTIFNDINKLYIDMKIITPVTFFLI